MGLGGGELLLLVKRNAYMGNIVATHIPRIIFIDARATVSSTLPPQYCETAAAITPTVHVMLNVGKYQRAQANNARAKTTCTLVP